ncbi:MAG: hypothetical protein H6733_06340 [Alphaproteobacteria bacterium]|nr:hypothetical protein [Alphaproteobacteria bacterium]
MRALVLIPMIAACSPTTDADGDTDTTDAVVRWFAGTLETFGTTTTYLMERTADPDRKLVAERVIYDAAPEPVSFRMVFDVDGADQSFALSFEDDFGTFEGDGTYEGTRWVWTRWTYDVAYVDGPFQGSHLYAENRLTDDDRYVSDQEVRSPEGFKEADQKVRANEVDEATWQAQADALTGG